MADVVIRVRAEDRASKVFGSIGKKMKSALKLGAVAGAAAVVAGAAISIKAFSDFDAAMTKSLAIMGDVSDSMRDDMAQAARDVAKVTKFSAEQAAESYFFLASAGLSAEASIAALPVVSQFAQAGMFDMALATDLLTDAQSALGLTVDDSAENMANMAKVSDVLVKANTLANATVQQFSTSLTREAGAAMRSFGMDIEEGVAVLAAFADQGVKGEIAGSGLARILRLMTAGAEKNSAAYTELGISVFDASGNLNNMADIVEDLEVALGDMSDVERIAALNALGFSARIQGVILPLLGTSQKIRDYEAALREAGGTTKEVAEKQLQTFSAQLGLLKDNLLDVAITVGAAVVPSLTSLIEKIIPVIAVFGSLIQGGKSAEKAFKKLPKPIAKFVKGLKNILRNSKKIIKFIVAFVSKGDDLHDLFDDIPKPLQEFTHRLTRLTLGLRDAGRAGAGIMGSLAGITGTLFTLFGMVGAQVFKDFVTLMGSFLNNVVVPLAEKLALAVGAVDSLGKSFSDNEAAMRTAKNILVPLVEAWLLLLAAKKVVTLTQNILHSGKAFINFLALKKNQVQNLTQLIKWSVAKGVTWVTDFAARLQNITQNVKRTGRKWITSFADKTQTITQKVKTVTPPKEMAKQFATSFGKGLATGAGAIIAPLALAIAAAAGVSFAVIGIAVAIILIAAIIGYLVIHFRKEIITFMTKTLPQFFTDTIPAFVSSIAAFASGLGKSVVGAIADWFTPQNVGTLLADIVAVALIAAFIGPILIIKFRKEIVSFFSFVIGTFIKFFTKTLPNAVVKVITKLAKGIFNAGKLFVKVRKEIGKFEIKVIKAFVKFMTKTLPSKIAGTASKFASAAIGFVTDLPTLVSEQGPLFLSKVSELVADVAAGFIEQAPIFAAKAIGFLADLPGLIGTFFLETLPRVISETVPVAVAAIISGISSLPGLVEEVFNSVTEKVTGWVNSVSTWLSENFAIWDWIKEAFNAFVTRIGEWLAKIWGSGLITEWVSKLGTWLTTNMNPWTWVKAAFELLVTSVGTEIGKVFTMAGGLVQGVIDAIGNVTETLVQKGIDLLKGLATGYLQVWSDVLTFFFNVSTKIIGIIGGLDALLYNVGKAILQGLLDGAKDKWEDVKGFFGGIADTILGLKGPASVDKVLLKGVGSLIIQGLIDGVKSMRASVESALGAFNPLMTSKMRAAGRSAIQGLVNGMSTAGVLIRDQLIRLRSFAVAVMRNAGKLLYIPGKNIVIGLINGMNSMIGTMIRNITNIINRIPAAVRRLLGLSSPSKLFFDFGADTMKGFELGLKRGLPKAMKVMGDIGVPGRAAVVDGGVTSRSALLGAVAGPTGDTFNFGPIYLSGPATHQDVRSLVDQVEAELNKRRRRGF